MIDPHVHFRDGEKERHKETVEHGISVAHRAGLDAAFDQSNTNPPLTTKERVAERLELGQRAIDKLGSDFFYGVYGGVQEVDGKLDERQIYSMLEMYFCQDSLLGVMGRMVGIKLFAGHSTNNLGVVREENQKMFYKTLADSGYKGVAAVHCEKERHINGDVFEPIDPYSHTVARSPIAELMSVEDQINFAAEAGFKGVLHICHVSVPQSLDYIEHARNLIDFRITCGITPHHAMLYDYLMQNPEGLLLKMNPPLRTREMQEIMLGALLAGRIDWIETDHAPHIKAEKIGKPYASGIPGLPFYPHFIQMLRSRGMSDEMLADVTHNNIMNAFELDVPLPDTKRYSGVDYNLAGEYQFDAFAKLK